jgi:hypothetical protein
LRSEIEEKKKEVSKRLGLIRDRERAAGVGFQIKSRVTNLHGKNDLSRNPGVLARPNK